MKECERVECMGSNGCIDKCWKPKSAWQGLTDEEITEIFSTTKGLDFYLNFARAIEAKLKDKNK